MTADDSARNAASGGSVSGKKRTCAGIAAILLAAVAASGQVGGPGVPGMPPSTTPPVAYPHPGSQVDPGLARIMHRQALARNTQRQKDLVNDTDKLLKLAQQLKAAVDKSNKDTLSIDVIKKADQIQKLAKSISSKMKGNY